jgi:S1-C subfamily serine protease
VSGNAALVRPDIVIGAAELQNVYVPPPPPKRAAQEVAAAFLPKQPLRISRMAVAALALLALSLIGSVGAFTGNTQVLTFGVVCAVGAIACGVLALVFIGNAENRIHGLPWAGAGTLGAVTVTVIYFACLGAQINRSGLQRETDLKLAENLPTDEQLERMSAPVRDAMRANVVVKSHSGFAETRYGSGVVVKLADRKALIVTNKHVIGDATKDIEILFYNGERSVAAVEWSAPEGVDLAVLGCRAFSLDKYRPIATAENRVGPGEKVFAVGNPMGLAWSYAEGTISSLRSSRAGAKDVELYQTQTPINSGNSGGGLYTAAGVLIGINTLTHDKATSEGLSFAISSAFALELLTPEERARLFGTCVKTGESKP